MHTTKDILYSVNISKKKKTHLLFEHFYIHLVLYKGWREDYMYTIV